VCQLSVKVKVEDELEEEKHSLRRSGNPSLPMKFRKYDDDDDETLDLITLH
jgi:hypothetical protein